MKAYPLIYSRTKLVDYVSGFLVRPPDLKPESAAVYVNKALENIKSSGGIRHAVFPAGNYLIYGGVASASYTLIQRILKESVLSAIDYPHQEFQADRSGRPIIFFIGFAIKREDLSELKMPDIDLYHTYKIYLEYLKRQWDSVNTSTETPEQIELNTVPYFGSFKPEELEWNGKRFVKDYREDEYKKYIQHYFAEMARVPQKECSFLSQALSDDVTENYPFTCVGFSDCSAEAGIAKLQKKRQVPYASSGASAPSEISSSSYKTDGDAKAENPFISSSHEYDARTDSKKNYENHLSGRVILAIAAALLIAMLILLIAHLGGKAKAVGKAAEESCVSAEQQEPQAQKENPLPATPQKPEAQTQKENSSVWAEQQEAQPQKENPLLTTPQELKTQAEKATDDSIMPTSQSAQ